MIRALTFSLILLTGVPAMATEPTFYDFTLTGNDGKPMVTEQFRGKVVLLVNTASECGFTPQFEGLEAVWEANKDSGLVIVGVPSDEFGGQEPGNNAEIATFCKLNYGVTFPLTDKSVVSGGSAIPVYKWANAKAGLLGSPKWNFHKYLIGRDGQFIDWFSSATKPTGPKIMAAVKKALGQ
jgi:glutathione peroxidase